MNTKQKLNKAALAFAILSIIAFVVTIAPGVLAIFLALAALFITLFGLLVFVIGGFIALLMLATDPGVWTSVSSLGSGAWQFAFHIFSIIPPITNFWFSGPAQICAGIGIGVGALAIILASVSMSLKSPENADEATEQQPDIAADNSPTEDTLDTDTLDAPAKDAKTEEKQKKHKRKEKTTRAISITCLVLGIVFAVLNAIALLLIFAIF